MKIFLKWIYKIEYITSCCKAHDKYFCTTYLEIKKITRNRRKEFMCWFSFVLQSDFAYLLFRNVLVESYRRKHSKKYTQNFSHMEVSINWNCGLDLIANTKLYLISKNVSIVHIHIVNNSINIYHLNPWIV